GGAFIGKNASPSHFVGSQMRGVPKNLSVVKNRSITVRFVRRCMAQAKSYVRIAGSRLGMNRVISLGHRGAVDSYDVNNRRLDLWCGERYLWVGNIAPNSDETFEGSFASITCSTEHTRTCNCCGCSRPFLTLYLRRPIRQRRQHLRRPIGPG